MSGNVKTTSRNLWLSASSLQLLMFGRSASIGTTISRRALTGVTQTNTLLASRPHTVADTRIASASFHAQHRSMTASKSNGNDANPAGGGNGGGGGGKVEPPKTGWKGPIPNAEGGSEEGYLFKPPYAWQSKEFKATYHAACWCDKVEFEFHGDPIDAKHCHCKQCQRLHGAPFQWAALYHKTSVRLKHSCDPMYLNFFSTQERQSDHSVPCKVSCRNCGSHILWVSKSLLSSVIR